MKKIRILLQGKLSIDHLRADYRYDSMAAVLKIIEAEKTSSLHRNSE